MDFHESLEDYYLTKKRLFELAKVSVFNVDDGYGRRAYKECLGKKISVGALFRGDVYASGITDRGFEGIGYLYHGRNFSFRMNLKTPGIYNVYNSLLAIAVATDLGEAPCRVKEALASFSGIDGRYEIIKDEITVIIDYAHTTAAFECILKSIRSAIGNKTLTVIFGAGGERDRTKRPKMASVAEKFADKIIVTEDNSRGEAPMEIITDIIYEKIKKGEPANTGLFLRVVDKLKALGCEKIILGCTELSLLKRNYKLGSDFIDSMEVLAASAIKLCGKETIGFDPELESFTPTI
jgi:UDP-N-acetylmuramoyl-L-alanyl-D-glutamate--2,6-diaminopimelate ligase